MKDKINFKLFKPFGSTIAKAELPIELLKDFNQDLKTIRASEELSKEHNFRHKLAGQIHQEFLISHEPMSKWKAQFFDPIIKAYAESHLKKHQVEKIVITAAWFVVQKPGDYNPNHTHTNFSDYQMNPDISCVGYLRIPENMKSFKNAKEHFDTSGHIEFIEGSENMFNDSNYLIKPELRTWYLFPSNLRHCVYPFFTEDENDERISFSFNAKVIFK
jgi:uncharacterized protein (TIGR02466 family)